MIPLSSKSDAPIIITMFKFLNPTRQLVLKKLRLQTYYVRSESINFSNESRIDNLFKGP